MEQSISKQQVVNQILKNCARDKINVSATAYAPANIALAKYWGKRNEIINLPFTSSLSISLGEYGATTTLQHSNKQDVYLLNHQEQDPNTEFSLRIKEYLDLFRPHPQFYFTVNTLSTVPIAAGVASSAAGFAALVLSLNEFFNWNLDKKALSILARLGSGSATRSLWNGFVEWYAGIAEDGMDSYGEPLVEQWPDLRVGLLLLSKEKKSISSREAMQRTVRTSPFYARWPQLVAHTVQDLRKAIRKKDFMSLGKTSESNALALHATMFVAQPPISYWLPETIVAMQKVWNLREADIPVFFTQDAGPNLKLLFLKEYQSIITTEFPDLIVVKPFI